MRLKAAAASLATAAALAATAHGDVTPTLAAKARWVAAHGGVYGHCYGCATPQMKALADQLVVQRFRSAGPSAVRSALCLTRREAGRNPGAVGPNPNQITTNSDIGLSQIHWAAHQQFNMYKLLDPVYGVEAFWIVSDHGTDFHPWDGGVYPCF